MLNLANIVPELCNLGEATFAGRERLVQQLRYALSVANTDAAQWSKLVEPFNSSEWNRPCARLVSCSPVGVKVDSSKDIADYTVIAVDGSQIPIDRHAALPYYLINIGSVVLHYDGVTRPLLASEPKLFYAESELFEEGGDGDRCFKTESEIGLIRDINEIEKLRELLQSVHNGRPVLGLVDGPLILWTQDPQERQRRTKPAVENLCNLFQTAQQKGDFIAGYISRSSSREIVNIIRNLVDSKLYVSALKSVAIDRLDDSQLFAAILGPGQRSILFESRAKVLQSYVAPYNRIGFFYLNTGNEIARIEIPIFEPNLEDRANVIQSLILDQITKGHGFPVALMEAHEKAVVRDADKQAVERLIENELTRRGITVSKTFKSLSKKTRII